MSSFQEQLETAGYIAPPLSSEQEAAEFRFVSPSGGVIEGRFIDGNEYSSYAISGRPAGNDKGPPHLFIFVRHGADVEKVATMLRVAADELEAQKSKTPDVFEGVDRP